MMEPEAGRDLDVLIAKKVMGLEPYLASAAIDGWNGDPKTEIWPHIEEGWDPRRVGQFVEMATRPPCYSIDIAAAWQVIERLHKSGRASGYGFELSRWPADSPDEWCAVFGNRNYGSSNRVEAVAETAPLAMCRAALKAVAPYAPLDYRRR